MFLASGDTVLTPATTTLPRVQYLLWGQYLVVIVVVTVELRGGGPMAGNVFVDGRPVCDDEWDLRDAAVVCRLLFNVSALAATTDSQFGRVGSDFSMDNVNCTGEEEDLRECHHETKDDCRGTEAAGVVCGGK